MADKKPHQPSEAMIDETLAESFPASDPPNWTSGIDNTQPSVEPPKGRVYTTREAVLALLSDAEVARVANLESAALLADGEEYIDLAGPERGVLRARPGQPLDMGHVLPRSALRDQTWASVVQAVHRDWQSPNSK